MSLSACKQTLRNVCLSGNKAEITNLVNVFVFLRIQHVCVFIFIISGFLGPSELHLVCGDFMLDLAHSCMVVWNPLEALPCREYLSLYSGKE